MVRLDIKIKGYFHESFDLRTFSDISKKQIKMAFLVKKKGKRNVY